MNPTPPGWPQISSSLTYEDASSAIDWLCKAFGFEVRIKVPGPDGKVMHSELTFGSGVVMVGDLREGHGPPNRKPPAAVGGANTQNLFVYVDDVEAHFARAKAAGARIVSEPATTDYGEEYWADHGYACVDVGGHHWWFAQRVRDGKA